MARIRTIKPEFWTDSKTGTMSEFAKCLFLGLLNHADDYGILEWAPTEYRAKIFPYHSDTTHGAVHGALADELLPRGLVILFSHSDDDGETKRFLFIRNFEKHQIVNRPSKPILAGWKKGDTPKTYASRLGVEVQELSTDQSGITHRTLTEHSSPERKGKERKGKEEERLSSDADAPAGDLDLVGGGYAANGRSRKPEKRDELEDEFAAWWLAYPKREAKGQARKAYAAARKKVSAEALLAAAQRAATLYASTEQKFIPFPATWLNGERWLDETAARDPPANAYTTGRSI